MKKTLAIFISLLILSITLPADHIGKLQITNPYFQMSESEKRPTFVMGEPFFLQACASGQLVIKQVQADTLLPGRSHERYQQFFKGMRIYGGQVIVEREKGVLINISGSYYPINTIDSQEKYSPKQAFDLLAHDLGITAEGFDLATHSRVIYPLEDGTYRLCHQLSIKIGPSQFETALIDVLDGSIYARDSNLKTGATIGLGVDFHGVNRKFPHTLVDGMYYLWDDRQIRPIQLATYDMSTGGYMSGSASEYWQNNGVNVSAHHNTGLVYDFLYRLLGRKGLDSNNLGMVVVTNRTDMLDNAFWDGQYINFCRSGYMRAQFAAALDVVAHECAHAVTQYSSDLTYSYQAGALNESFSDIIGAACEQYWQPAGSGLNMADWFIGEDAFPNYNYGINSGYCRYLADPNLYSQMGDKVHYPDPCHLSQYYQLPFSTDRGGVHINMTIYSHAFYLLAVGGTNRISNLTVQGLGLEKALRIYYRAWVYKLTENSQFVDAARALINSASDLYGLNSNEYAQTVKDIQAIGYTVI